MSALSDATGGLCTALSEEARLCTDLLAVTRREERAIIDADIPTLTAIVDEKEQLLELLATLETERMTALTAIAAATGREAATLSISGIIDLVGPQQRARLIALSDGLRTDGQALEQANARNAQLLRMSRDLVDRWVQYLKAMLTGSLTYTPDGSTQGATGNRMLDRSA